ncbi:MAG: GtrA family protein [Desulfovibrio sp.]|jgi:putative flippase GtrA|nr:GtrA family protein [Desulfovibrio sp.]
MKPDKGQAEEDGRATGRSLFASFCHNLPRGVSSFLRSDKTPEAGRLLKFSLVGLINCLVDYVLYLALSLFFSLYISRTFSWMGSCLFSYLANRRWTFQARNAGTGSLIRFAAVNLGSLSLGIILLYLFLSIGWGRSGAYFLSLPFTMLTNYLGYRCWAFARIS